MNDPQTIQSGQGMLMNSYDDGSKDKKNAAMLSALKNKRQKMMSELAQEPEKSKMALEKADDVEMAKPQKYMKVKDFNKNN